MRVERIWLRVFEVAETVNINDDISTSGDCLKNTVGRWCGHKDSVFGPGPRVEDFVEPQSRLILFVFLSGKAHKGQPMNPFTDFFPVGEDKTDLVFFGLAGRTGTELERVRQDCCSAENDSFPRGS